MLKFNTLTCRAGYFFAGAIVLTITGPVQGSDTDGGVSNSKPLLLAEYRNNYLNKPSGNASGGNSSAPLLNMEVSHSDYLPSLPKSLHQGNYFQGWSNSGISRRIKQNGNQSFEIPKWLAGKWKRNQSTETKRVKLPEGKSLKTTGTTMARSEDVFGTYEDSEGKIWQVFDPRQATGVVDRGEFIDHHRVMNYKIEILDPNTVVVEVTASHLVVNKEKKQIAKSFQDEEFNTYTYLGNGKAKTESSVKVFDQLGKPEVLTHSVSYVDRTESLE